MIWTSLSVLFVFCLTTILLSYIFISKNKLFGFVFSACISTVFVGLEGLILFYLFKSDTAITLTTATIVIGICFMWRIWACKYTPILKNWDKMLGRLVAYIDMCAKEAKAKEEEENENLTLINGQIIRVNTRGILVCENSIVIYISGINTTFLFDNDYWCGYCFFKGHRFIGDNNYKIRHFEYRKGLQRRWSH